MRPCALGDKNRYAVKTIRTGALEKSIANVMPIITSRDRLPVSCRIGKDPGRAKETPCRNWSTQAQRDDTVKREYAETRYAENTLIWIACYMVRYKVRQSYEKICRAG